MSGQNHSSNFTFLRSQKFLAGRPIHALPTGATAFLLSSPRPGDFAVLGSQQELAVGGQLGWKQADPPSFPHGFGACVVQHEITEQCSGSESQVF